MSKKATEFQRKAMSWMYRGKEIFKPLNTGWIDAISSEDMARQIEGVEDLIVKLGAGTTPCIRVYNKCDKYLGLLPRGENTVCISARTGEGTAELVKMIAEILGRESRRVTLLLPYDKAGIADTLRREAAVLSVDYGEDGVTVEAVVKPELWGLVREYVKEEE